MKSSMQRKSSAGVTLPVKLNLSDLPLFGRNEQIAQLHEVYQRVVVTHRSRQEDDGAPSSVSELVLVTGRSGTGKTALVSTLREEAALKGKGYYVSGKFDQMSSSQPYAAMAEAFTELSENMMENEKVRTRLQESLGDEDRAVLVNAIPKLGSLLGRDSGNTDNKGCLKEFGFERLKLALQAFLRVVCHPSQPVIIFIDDIQWSDDCTLEMIMDIASDREIRGLLFVLACRQADVGDSHPTAERVKQMGTKCDGLCIHEIHVADLESNTLNALVAKVIGLEESEAMSLTEVVHRKTQGNPFFAIQFLRLLEEKELLYRSTFTYKCEWDIDRILTETPISENVVDLMASKIERLPPLGREALKVGACLGTHFDAELVSSILADSHDQSYQEEVSEPPSRDLVRSVLQDAAKEGLIDGNADSSFYQFAHDRIQQGAYSLVLEGPEREALHYRIGRLLESRNGTTEWIEWMLLLSADQLNLGSALINDANERLALARLNMEAANYVLKLSAFFPAVEYLEKGIALVPGESKWDTDYDLMLKLCTMLAEMNYCCGNFRACEDMANEVFLHARSLPDQLRARFILVESLGAEGDLEKAQKAGKEVLGMLGERYPRTPSQLQMLLEIIRTKRLLKGRSDNDLLSLPPMMQPNHLATIRIISSCALYAYQNAEMDLWALLMLREFRLSLRHGLSKSSAHSFSTYGVVAGVLGEFDEAYRFARLAIEMMDRQNTATSDSRVVVVVYSFLYHLKHPLHDCIDPLLQAYNTCMEIGDMKYASMNAIAYSLVYFFCGLPLLPLHKDLTSFGAQLTKYHQTTSMAVVLIYHQCACNFMGHADDPLVLTGEIMNQEAMEEQTKTRNIALASQSIWFMRMILGYYFRDLELAADMADLIWQDPSVISGTHIYVAIFHFYAGLVHLEMARKTRKRKHKKLASRALKVIEKWVKAESVNCHHMILFLYAERDSLNKKDTNTVKRAYDQAISSASRSGFTQHAALANERAGLFFLERNDEEWAEFYLNRSCELYAEWGATAKVHQLREMHSFLSRQRENSVLLKSSRFLKGRSKFSPENEAKHEGKNLKDLVGSAEFSTSSQTSQTSFFNSSGSSFRNLGSSFFDSSGTSDFSSLRESEFESIPEGSRSEDTSSEPHSTTASKKYASETGSP